MSLKLVKQAKQLLLSGVVLGIGLWAMPVHAQVSNAQVGRLVEALLQAAPQDRPDDDLYGAWQVKAENIPSWSQRCLGKELTPMQFQESPVTARSVLVCVMRDVMRDQYQARITMSL